MISPHPCPLTAPTRAHEKSSTVSLSRDTHPTTDDRRRPTTVETTPTPTPHRHRRRHHHHPRTNFACIAALDVDGAPLIAPRGADPRARGRSNVRTFGHSDVRTFGHSKPTHPRARSIDTTPRWTPLAIDRRDRSNPIQSNRTDRWRRAARAQGGVRAREGGHRARVVYTSPQT